MFEQFRRLDTLMNQAFPVLQSYLPAEQIEAFKTEFKQRTENQQPIVMVYGVYNAGKSTLINALAGAELAEVGDIPKTDRVDAYAVGEVTLLDTPGIDAPIDHERITRDQLAKADAVVFVLSSGGVLEEHSTYQEIKEILQAGKPLLVVINNKHDYKPQDANYIALVEKFRQNLKDFLADEPLLLTRLAEVEDFLVNAKLALKAKLEHKAPLLAHSQLPELEKALGRLFAKTNSAQIAKTLSVQLSTLVQQALGQAEQGKQSSELMQLQQLISDAQAGKRQVRERTLSFALTDKAAIKAELNQLLQQGQASQANHCLENWQHTLSSYFNDQVEQTLSALDLEAAAVAQVLLQQTTLLEAEMGETQGTVQSGLGELIGALAQNGISLKLGEELTQEGIVFALKQGKAWFPALFKGVGTKTMGKWASRATPLIGTAMDVFMAVYDYYQANEQAKRQIEQQRAQYEKITTKVHSLVESICEELAYVVDEQLAIVFDPILNELQNALAVLSAKEEGVEADIAELKRYQLLCDDF